MGVAGIPMGNAEGWWGVENHARDRAADGQKQDEQDRPAGAGVWSAFVRAAMLRSYFVSSGQTGPVSRPPKTAWIHSIRPSALYLKM